MQAGTLIEISPVLVFPREEWLTYGNKTLLDCYTFKWGGMGDMALALGLGEIVAKDFVSQSCSTLNLRSLP